MRLFVAISLPQHVQDGIAEAQLEMRQALPGGDMRWTRPVQFHLTLKFLGDVDPRHVEALTDALRQAGHGYSGLTLRARGVGVFPDRRNPRLLWAGVDDAGERLPVLQRAVEAAAVPFVSLAPEERFTGHVTFGRCRRLDHRQAELLTTQLAAMESRRFGEWTPGTVEIVRSEPGSGGSRYTTMSAVSLG